MSLELGARVADAYVRWSLFLSSFVPLLLIFAVRLSESHATSTFVAISIAGILILNLSFLLNRRIGARVFSLETVDSGSNEVAGYIATYLLPFLVVGDVGWRDLLAYALLVWAIGQAMTRDDVLHINPLLSLLQYHIYTVTTVDGAKYYLIATSKIAPRSKVRVIVFLDRLMLER